MVDKHTVLLHYVLSHMAEGLFSYELFFFFFLISRNVIYTNGYSMHEKHRANPENTKMKNKEKTKKKTNPQINYKEKES